MFFLVGLLAVVVSLLVLAIVFRTKERNNSPGRYADWGTLSSTFTVCVIVFTIILIIASGWSAFGNLDTAGKVSKMNAFYHETLSAYEYAVNRTEQVVIDVSGTRANSITDFSYDEQGKAVSERLKELRDLVAWYNETLRYLRVTNEWPILGDFYYDVPVDLKPIILK